MEKLNTKQNYRIMTQTEQMLWEKMSSAVLVDMKLPQLSDLQKCNVCEQFMKQSAIK